jgi:SsrA-binding protein
MAFIDNKKALFNYEIVEKYEAGLQLEGYEVKAIRLGRGQLLGSYVIVSAGEAFLKGLKVTPVQQKNLPAHFAESRFIKLLLNKKEIVELYKKLEQKGLTLIPLSIYDKGGKIKCEIALVKGKKLFDKRRVLKERDDKREMGRVTKQYK